MPSLCTSTKVQCFLTAMENQERERERKQGGGGGQTHRERQRQRWGEREERFIYSMVYSFVDLSLDQCQKRKNERKKGHSLPPMSWLPIPHCKIKNVSKQKTGHEYPLNLFCTNWSPNFSKEKTGHAWPTLCLITYLFCTNQLPDFSNKKTTGHAYHLNPFRTNWLPDL